MKWPVIYIVRKYAMGDAFWIEPLVRELAGKFKKVIVHTKYNQVFDHYDLPNVRFRKSLNIVEKVWLRVERLLRLRILFIDLDMSYEKDTHCHILEAYCRKAGVHMPLRYPELFLSEEEKKPVVEDKRPLVVLHLDTTSPKNYRQVYGVNWDTVVAYLDARGFRVIQVGAGDAGISGADHIKTSIRQLISLINQSVFFIGLDSGPSHFAASLGKPSLLFFGAVNPWFRQLKDQFKGHIMQSYCEFGHCYHDLVGKEVVCRLVGEQGIPKCCVHETGEVIRQIELLLGKFQIKDVS